MKHKIKGRKFKRSKSQRKALLRHLSEAIIINEKIITTSERAKELSPYIEKLITVAKKENLSSIRQIYGNLSNKASKKLIENISKRYKERNGGYTRIIKAGERNHDSAKLSVIEFV